LKQPNYRQAKKQREDAKRKRNDAKKQRKEPSNPPTEVPRA
jgi:hypothetical protein